MNNEIQNKLHYLLDTKAIFKSTLIGIGAEIDDTTPFREYINFFAGLIPSSEEMVIQLLQTLNYIDVHQQGGDIQTLNELENIYDEFVTLITPAYGEENIEEANNG